MKDSNQPLGDNRPPMPQNPPELWTILALVLLVATLAGHIYIFRGPGGEASLWLYKKGRFAAGLGAWLIGILGLVTALRRPPLVRRWRIEGFLLLILIVFTAPIPYGYPSPRRDRPSEVLFELPVRDGTWRVLYGGGGGVHNPLALEPDRSHGLLLARDEDGTRWRIEDYDATVSEQSLSYGQIVFAPADGLIVAAVNDEPDRSFKHREEGGTERGNHVVIEVAPGEFCILAHLQRGSVALEAGDSVKQGQKLGLVGSSGRGVPLEEPHLDMHLSTRPEEGQGEGIPFFFHGYEGSDGLVEKGIPKGGLGYQGQMDGDLVRRPGLRELKGD
ncbi:MAG: M23 family metallopeptidase [Planctomycetota bacterium]|nr:M23 family metallopeptidase [Sulfitobacter sp.]MDF1838587.1 M23 family metallopeptidase [Planctomycetota bacterium]